MKLGIGMGIVDTLPGEAFAHHMSVFVEAAKTFTDTFSVIPVGVFPHDNCRTVIMDKAIEVGCDRLFMMDDDTITPRGGLTALMKEMDERKCAAISGYYIRRGHPYTSVWTRLHEGNWYVMDGTSGGVHPIDCSGLGCCLIDLNWVKDNIPKPWFKMVQNETHTLITDDVEFFKKIREANGVILGHAEVQCDHIGRREIINFGTAPILRLYAEKVESLQLQRRTLSMSETKQS